MPNIACVWCDKEIKDGELVYQIRFGSMEAGDFEVDADYIYLHANCMDGYEGDVWDRKTLVKGDAHG